MGNVQNVEFGKQEVVEKDPKQVYDEYVVEMRAKSAEEVVEYLGDKHKIDTYIFIRDIMTAEQLKAIKSDKDLELKFRRIKRDANNAWTDAHSPATKAEVNSAVTTMYTTIMKILQQMNTMITADLEEHELQLAAIRAHIGMQEPLGVEHVGYHQCDCGNTDCGECEKRTEDSGEPNESGSDNQPT